MNTEPLISPPASSPTPAPISPETGSATDNNSVPVENRTSPPAPPDLTPVPVEVQYQDPQLVNPGPLRSPRSKIAQLPKAVRDQLNTLLRDGFQHQAALAKLGDAAKGISERDVSSWHSSPSYQHWLLEQDWLDKLREDQESAFDLLNDFDAPKFNEASLQLAVTRLFFAFRHLDAGDLNQRLGGNARTFAGLVQSLARACRESTNIQKYREDCARAIAAELKQLNTDRELSDREYQLLINKMDRVFKVARRPTPVPAPPPPNGSA